MLIFFSNLLTPYILGLRERNYLKFMHFAEITLIGSSNLNWQSQFKIVGLKSVESNDTKH